MEPPRLAWQNAWMPSDATAAPARPKRIFSGMQPTSDSLHLGN